MVDDSNDETNFSYNLLLTKTQVSRLRKAFLNGSSANIYFSKTQLSMMVQLGGIVPALGPCGFLDGLKNLGEEILSSIKITATEYDENDENISNKDLIVDIGLDFLGRKLNGSGIALRNNELNNIIKIIRSLERRLILLKQTTKKLLLKKKDISMLLIQ